MGARLKVDVDQVRESGATVAHIRAELLGAKDIVDGYTEAIGDATLSGKLHDFATNWDAHRERICEDLDVFAKWPSRPRTPTTTPRTR